MGRLITKSAGWLYQLSGTESIRKENVITIQADEDYKIVGWTIWCELSYGSLKAYAEVQVSKYPKMVEVTGKSSDEQVNVPDNALIDWIYNEQLAIDHGTYGGPGSPRMVNKTVMLPQGSYIEWNKNETINVHVYANADSLSWVALGLVLYLEKR